MSNFKTKNNLDFFQYLKEPPQPKKKVNETKQKLSTNNTTYTFKKFIKLKMLLGLDLFSPLAI